MIRSRESLLSPNASEVFDDETEDTLEKEEAIPISPSFLSVSGKSSAYNSFRLDVANAFIQQDGDRSASTGLAVSSTSTRIIETRSRISPAYKAVVPTMHSFSAHSVPRLSSTRKAGSCLKQYAILKPDSEPADNADSFTMHRFLDNAQSGSITDASNSEEAIPSPPSFQRVSGKSTVYNSIRLDGSDALMQHGYFESSDVSLHSSSTRIIGNRAQLSPTYRSVAPTMQNRPVHSVSRLYTKQKADFTCFKQCVPLKHDSETAKKEESLKMNRLRENLPSERIIETKQGLAVLLNGLPQKTTASLSTRSQNRKFQRWSKEEDALLLTAVELEKSTKSVSGMTTINWKRIANDYFHGSRTDIQCKGRWKKVFSIRPLHLLSIIASCCTLTYHIVML